MRTFLSLGAGVDTTAILRIPELVTQMDFVMFADTGGEHPETYEYIKNWIAPFLEAEKFARERWPGLKLFTYVSKTKVKSKNPGWCFMKAGWKLVGENKTGKLRLFEKEAE